jgi:hypothetical protein
MCRSIEFFYSDAQRTGLAAVLEFYDVQPELQPKKITDVEDKN